ncbi:hypothetical protein SESBI_21686 [Sesbania bispinosa]|nr:hypothetical protein SESBI_21686 [Sesbania bispinosa]
MSSFTFSATCPLDKPSDGPSQPISFRDKVLGVCQVQHQQEYDDLLASQKGEESHGSGRVSSMEVKGGGASVNDCVEDNCVPGVDSDGRAYSLHGNWLNVTRKKRGKSGGCYKDNMVGSESVIGEREQAQLLESKGRSRKKRPCMGQQSMLDVRKLLDNAAKARVHIADRVKTRVGMGSNGVGTSGLKNSSPEPIDDSRMRLGYPVNGSSWKHKSISKGARTPSHPFNISIAMNVEVIGPNHLRIVDDVEPPDDLVTQDDPDCPSSRSDGNNLPVPGGGEVVGNDVVGTTNDDKDESSVLGNDRVVHAPDMEVG